MKSLHKRFNLIAIVTSVVAMFTMIAVTTVACSKNTTTSPKTSIYNQWATDLSQSDNDFDQQVLTWYQQNTASLFVGIGREGSQGTIWNYPNTKGDKLQYFATNIHVIAEALIPTSNHQYILNPSYDFAFSMGPNHFDWLNNVNLSYIATQATPSGLSSTLWEGEWYNDFVILSTTTKVFGNVNKMNYLDTPEEYQWLLDNEPVYYLGGYPALNDTTWPNSSAWVNIKYLTEKATTEAAYRPELGTAADLDSNYFLPSIDKGLVIGSGDNELLAKNYAYQILLPGLNVGHGSSGSLVSVEYKGSLMMVGIYWGGYEISSGKGSEFLGGVNLLYTAQSYQYGRYGTAAPYNNWN